MDAVTRPTNAAQKATGREWLGLAVLALGALMYVMDLTVLHLAVPAMSADLQPTSSQLLWIIDIYGFFVAGTLITMGTLGDRVGRRKLLLIGAAGFGITSIMAAYSWSAEMLILSRALLGLSGATLAPATLSLIFSMFHDPRERSIAVGVWIGAFSAGSAIGPILGGIMLEFFWWGSVFLLALPVMAALLILGPRILPEYRDPTAGRLDLPSAAMAITAILALIYGLKEIAAYGLSVVAVGSVVIGIVVGVLWVARQRRLDDPMIDIRLFRNRVFDTALGVNFLAVFVAVGYFLFVAQYLQLVAGLSPLQAGLWSLPSALAFIVGSQAGPRIAGRVKPATIVGAGLAVAGVGLVMLAFVDGAGQLLLLVAASVVISLGLAPVFGLTTELIVGSAPEEKAGAASGISETGSELGGALGIAILGSIGVVIYRSTLARELPAELPEAVVEAASDTLGAATTVAAEIPAEMGAAVLGVAQSAFVDGMQVSAAIAAVVAFGLALVAAVMLRGGPTADAQPTSEAEPGERFSGERASLGLEPTPECG